MPDRTSSRTLDRSGHVSRRRPRRASFIHLIELALWRSDGCSGHGLGIASRTLGSDSAAFHFASGVFAGMDSIFRLQLKGCCSGSCVLQCSLGCPARRAGADECSARAIGRRRDPWRGSLLQNEVHYLAAGQVGVRERRRAGDGSLRDELRACFDPGRRTSRPNARDSSLRAHSLRRSGCERRRRMRLLGADHRDAPLVIDPPRAIAPGELFFENGANGACGTFAGAGTGTRAVEDQRSLGRNNGFLLPDPIFHDLRNRYFKDAVQLRSSLTNLAAFAAFDVDCGSDEPGCRATGPPLRRRSRFSAVQAAFQHDVFRLGRAPERALDPCSGPRFLGGVRALARSLCRKPGSDGFSSDRGFLSRRIPHSLAGDGAASARSS